MADRPRLNVMKFPIHSLGFNLRKRSTKKKYLKHKDCKRKRMYADRKTQQEKEILGDRREKFYQLYVAVFDQ